MILLEIDMIIGYKLVINIDFFFGHFRSRYGVSPDERRSVLRRTELSSVQSTEIFPRDACPVEL